VWCVCVGVCVRVWVGGFGCVGGLLRVSVCVCEHVCACVCAWVWVCVRLCVWFVCVGGWVYA
jgi:hypothetical protein